VTNGSAVDPLFGRESSLQLFGIHKPEHQGDRTEDRRLRNPRRYESEECNGPDNQSGDPEHHKVEAARNKNFAR
jgi:hypothetical protein